MSAIQAAAPALAIFTPSGGGTSEGLSPTMFPKTGVKSLHKYTQTLNHQDCHVGNQHIIINLRSFMFYTVQLVNDVFFYELTIKLQPDDMKHTYIVCLKLKGSC